MESGTDWSPIRRCVMSTTVLRALAVAALSVGMVACGTDDVAVPTADELADRLVTVDT
jgi:hypothetical protein